MGWPKGVPVPDYVKEKLKHALSGPKNPNYGKTFSEETRRRMSLAVRGRKCSPKIVRKRAESLKKTIQNYPKDKRAMWNKRVSASLQGHEFSQETRSKISRSLKGRYHGSLNPAWKGGINPLVKTIRTSDKYAVWRSEVFKRDDYTCRDCRVRGGPIEAHHVVPFTVIVKGNGIKTMAEAENCEGLWDVDNGKTLCKECHRRTKIKKKEEA